MSGCNQGLMTGPSYMSRWGVPRTTPYLLEVRTTPGQYEILVQAKYKGKKAKNFLRALHALNRWGVPQTTPPTFWRGSEPPPPPSRSSKPGCNVLKKWYTWVLKTSLKRWKKLQQLYVRCAPSFLFLYVDSSQAQEALREGLERDRQARSALSGAVTEAVTERTSTDLVLVRDSAKTVFEVGLQTQPGVYLAFAPVAQALPTTVLVSA
jgi:hypothetical protein